jgi:DNA-binding transcriptional MerR regulator
MDLRYELVVVREDPDQLTLSELASLVGADAATIRYYIDMGLVEPVSRVGSQLLFDANALRRLRAIGRLRRDLGANISSLGMIMDLVDKIRALQHEVEILRSRL